MIPLLIKSSVIIAILLTFYKTILEKESFFATNRIFIIGCILLTFALPFLSLPSLIDQQGIISSLIERTELSKPMAPQQVMNQAEDVYQSAYINSSESINQSENISTPIRSENPALTPDVGKQNRAKQKTGWIHWLLIIYLFGATVFLLNLLAQIGGLFIRAIRSTDKVYDNKVIIINTPEAQAPCSFFNYIFIHPESYDYDTYEQIVAHEKIHIRKLHTLDLLLSEIAVVFLWFNPLIWIFRKEVEKNIEFQTDNLLVNSIHIQKEGYQMNLLRIATFNRPLAVTTNYNQSQIKQRILKMSAKKSNPYSYWKYAFVAPLVFVMMLMLNKPFSAMAQAEIAETAIMNEDPGCKALLRAIKEQDIPTIGELLNSVDPNCIDSNPDTEVITTKGGQKYYTRNPRTPLVAAAKIGNLTIGEMLIDAKADIEFFAKGDETPLMMASKNGNIDFVRYLLASGADINRKLKGEGTALMAAARNGQLETIKLLLGEGADINAMVPGEGTPLLVAARNGHLETIKLLLAEGADINAMVPGEGTPLLVAARNGHLETIKFLLAEGADINAMVHGEGTPLLAAARNGHLETIKLLLAEGADINVMVPGEGTPLLVAARNGHLETLEFLISHEAEIDVVVPGEGTALIAAVRNKQFEAVTLLLEKGADPNLHTPGNEYPMYHARKSKDQSMIDLLEKHAESY